MLMALLIPVVLGFVIGLIAFSRGRIGSSAPQFA